jgi:hypothetical protein
MRPCIFINISPIAHIPPHNSTIWSCHTTPSWSVSSTITHTVSLPSIQLYPSADAVIILNAASLALIRVLAFSEAFPHPEDRISTVSVDAGMKLVRPAVQASIPFSFFSV